MPASDFDPLASALAATFKPKGPNKNTMSLPAKMETSLRKSLLVPVQFDDAVVVSKANVNPNYIVLKSSHTNNKLSNGARPDAASNGQQSISSSSPKASSKPKHLDQVPAPKITLYRKEQVQVGYNRMTGAGSGMRNMGNTCYLNSTLQALFHIPAFVNYLHSGGHDKECGISGFSCCTICILNSTLRQTQQSNVIKPIRIYEKLKFICKHLVHGRQEDAHEFLRYLIESLQRCYLISRKVPKTVDNYSKETTPFNQIFGGYLRQELHCLKCRHVSITFQHFMDLMLDIRNADNIDSALCGYFKKEFLSQEDAYKCEKCKQKVPAHKIYRIERPPLVLCIQLKRFNIMGGKNGRPVTLSKNLDITKFIRWAAGHNLSFNYNITSLITHVGPSPNCGHYTAIGQAPNGTYYRFDDDCVNPTSVQNVLNNSAYVIFYEMTKSSRDRYIAAMADANNVASPKTQNGTAFNNTSKASDVVIGPQLPPNVLNRKVENKVNSKHPLAPFPSTSSSNVKISASSSGVSAPLANKNTVDNNKFSNSNNKVNNMPRIVSEKQSSIDKDRNKFGVAVGNAKSINAKSAAAVPANVGLGLVPDYGDGSSSDEDKEVANISNSSPKLSPAKSVANDSSTNTDKSSQGKVVKSNKSIFPAIKTPFLPRAVAANLKKNVVESVKNDAPASSTPPTTTKAGLDIYDDQDLVTNEAAVTHNGNGLADLLPDKCSQERHGFMVSDKEEHNPSIHSDNSSGSTVSFTVSDIRPGSGGAASSSSTGATSRQNWNVVSVKRDRSDEDIPSQDIQASPSKKSKLKEKSMLDGVKTKTSETWREFSKDVLSAGAKLKQQFEVRSSKVTDKIESLTKNIEEILPKFEEPSTSCEASTSQGSSKSKEAAGEDAASESEESSRKKNKKKKKKKKKKVERSRSRSLDRSNCRKERSRSRSIEKCSSDRARLDDRLKGDDSSDHKNGDIRYSTWDASAPVKRWDNKNCEPDQRHKLDRSATWDGSKKNSNVEDEIKRRSTIRGWDGQESKNEEKRERKRSISPSTDDEMDRGRVKKVKKKKEERHYGYNPFQAVQNMKDQGGASSMRNKYKRNRSHSGYPDSHRSKDGHRDFKRRDRSEDYSRGYHNHHRRSSWDHNYHRK